METHSLPARKNYSDMLKDPFSRIETLANRYDPGSKDTRFHLAETLLDKATSR